MNCYYLNSSGKVLYFLLSDPASPMIRPDVLRFNKKRTEFDFMGDTAELRDLLEVFPDLEYRLWKHLNNRLKLLSKALEKPYTEGKEELYQQRDGLITAFIEIINPKA